MLLGNPSACATSAGACVKVEGVHPLTARETLKFLNSYSLLLGDKVFPGFNGDKWKLIFVWKFLRHFSAELWHCF